MWGWLCAELSGGAVSRDAAPPGSCEYNELTSTPALLLLSCWAPCDTRLRVKFSLLI